MPSREERIKTLVLKLGFMPYEAERIVNAAANDDGLPTAEQLAMEDEAEGMGVEATRMWWWWNVDIPLEYKRLLEAPDVG